MNTIKVKTNSPFVAKYGGYLLQAIQFLTTFAFVGFAVASCVCAFVVVLATFDYWLVHGFNTVPPTVGIAVIMAFMLAAFSRLTRFVLNPYGVKAKRNIIVSDKYEGRLNTLSDETTEDIYLNRDEYKASQVRR